MRQLGCIEAASRYMETKQLPRGAQIEWALALKRYPEHFAEFVADCFNACVLKEDTLASLVSG